VVDTTSSWRRWLREPLLHFVVLGAAVFAVYAAIEDSPNEPLSLGDAPVDQLARDWKARTGAEPTPLQRARLEREWIEEEALYRRALELNLDESDTVVRRRLVQRMRFLIEDTTPVPEPDDATLQSWIDAHAADYNQPSRLSFEHRFFSRGKRKARIAADAQAAAQKLTASPDASVSGDPFPRGELFHDQTPAAIARTFGRAFADRTMELPVGRWSDPIESSYGLHVVRVKARREAEPPSLEAVRERARADWMYAERQRLNQQAVDRIIERYAGQGNARP
jgi:peptidyl-prolyl cis-trans isomerase C